MANVYKPQLIQIRPQYSVETDAPDKPENITWWKSNTAGTPSLGDLQAIGNIFDAHWPNVWGAIAGDVATYTGSIISDWSSNTGLVLSSVGVISAVPGTHGQLLPPQVAVLVSYAIGLRYKGGHPRSYLPYVGQGVVSGVYNDTVTTAAATACTTAITGLVTAMEGSGVLGGQGLVAYLHKTDPVRANPVDVIGQSIGVIVATQRRRVRRVAHK